MTSQSRHSSLARLLRGRVRVRVRVRVRLRVSARVRVRARARARVRGRGSLARRFQRSTKSAAHTDMKRA
eukprot:scaffold13868_cov48-Phaeocystis_antarctica.AAC.3